MTENLQVLPKLEAQITEEQWLLYQKKYGSLLWKIARKISGDEAIANIEDNHADLCMAAINSIYAFRTLINVEIDGFLKEVDDDYNSRQFTKYTKTCVWNYKCKKGLPLSNKMDFRKKHFSISAVGYDDGTGEGKDFDIEDKSGPGEEHFVINELFKESTPEMDLVVKAILNDPSVLKEDGSLNRLSLMKPTGLSIYAINKAVGSIERILRRETAA
jgi:hypothetical protein